MGFSLKRIILHYYSWWFWKKLKHIQPQQFPFDIGNTKTNSFHLLKIIKRLNAPLELNSEILPIHDPDYAMSSIPQQSLAILMDKKKNAKLLNNCHLTSSLYNLLKNAATPRSIKMTTVFWYHFFEKDFTMPG